MPVYNSDPTLAAAIESVLGQTYTGFELIISDNASTDASWEICTRYAARDARIRLLRNAVNLGGNPNYRKVAVSARCEYFKWASSNDLLAPDYLARCIAALDRQPDAVLAFGATLLFEDDPARGIPYDDRMDFQDEDPVVRFRRCLEGMRLNNVVNGVVRLGVLRQTSLMADYMGSDNVLVAELALAGKFVRVPETRFYRRMSRQSATRLQSREEVHRHHYPTARIGGFFQAWQLAGGCVRAVLGARLSLAARLRTAAYVVRQLYWLSPDLGADVGEAFRFYVLPSSAPRPLRVLTLTADGDDYTTCFHAALRRQGVQVQQAEWSGRWLYANVRRHDIVLLHWPSFLYYLPGSRLATGINLLRFVAFMLALRLRGAKIAWTAHNLYPHDGGRAALSHRVGRRVVARLASAIGVHGKNAAERVGEEFGVAPAKLVLLEHGHWVGFFANTVPRSAARARLAIPPDAFLFLFIGLCKPYKNLEYLVRSHAAMAQDDSLLWIVGRFQSKDYYAQVTQAATQAAPSRTTIRDEFIAAEDMQTYLNACDAVVLPYREILTSGAAMLAFSFGRPVVAPRMGTLKELVTEECGVLYDPGAEGALTAALRRARERHFNAGTIIRRALQYSWDHSARAFAQKIAAIR